MHGVHPFNFTPFSRYCFASDIETLQRICPRYWCHRNAILPASTFNVLLDKQIFPLQIQVNNLPSTLLNSGQLQRFITSRPTIESQANIAVVITRQSSGTIKGLGFPDILPFVPNRQCLLGSLKFSPLNIR